jgi:hypothetical protein
LGWGAWTHFLKYLQLVQLILHLDFYNRDSMPLLFSSIDPSSECGLLSQTWLAVSSKNYENSQSTYHIVLYLMWMLSETRGQMWCLACYYASMTMNVRGNCTGCCTFAALIVLHVSKTDMSEPMNKADLL